MSNELGTLIGMVLIVFGIIGVVMGLLIWYKKSKTTNLFIQQQSK